MYSFEPLSNGGYDKQKKTMYTSMLWNRGLKEYVKIDHRFVERMAMYTFLSF